MKTLDDEGISIDALVNNAGITGPKRRMEEVTAETLEGVMRVNITGVVLMCREAVKRMSTTHGGRGGVIVTYLRQQQLREAPINGLII
jgi:NAD(P)-dependent dehydrogenase (short-subunit alcohol dehydrogenase family)